MLLPDIDLRMSYDSGELGVDVVRDFYVPALSVAKSYDRLAGFFSSTSLAVAARGIAGLLANDGKMRLATSPRLTPEDVPIIESICRGEEPDAQTLTDLLRRGLQEDLGDEIAKNHVRALGWMLSNDRLEVRIVKPTPKSGFEGLFHMKVGLIWDSAGRAVAFDGSLNESLSGWYRNIERFSVFANWRGEEARVEDVLRTFVRYWESPGPSARTWRLPDAVAEQLIQLAPRDVDELDLGYADRGVAAVPGFTPQESPAHFPELRWYQEEAISAWEENGCRGMLEMATGTGKTLAALTAAKRLAGRSKRLLVVIAVPQNHLAEQWTDDVLPMFPDSRIVQAGSDFSGWKSRLLSAVAALAAGGSGDVAVCIAVHKTAGLEGFSDVVNRAAAAGCQTLLIADEAHDLGAERIGAALLDCYQHRLGLSATPERFYDSSGTARLMDYFGGVVFKFGLPEALAEGVLTPYEYHCTFVQLNEDELAEYRELTSRAARAAFATRRDGGAGASQAEERFLQQRAAVVKKAASKIDAFYALLELLGERLQHCIVYCLDTDQMSLVDEVLDARHIVYRHFTGDESKPDRSRILGSFENGDTKVLVAMKCLDQGVDVREARTGIILASSTNPRESIQRRGRLLRLHKDKERAHIYDLIVSPDLERIDDPVLRQVELRLFLKELRRLEEFAASAMNAAECYAQVADELARLETPGDAVLYD